MGKDVIVALDFPTGKEALDFLDLFQKEEWKPYVKVGMELFYSEVRQIKKRGHSIFLDLKLHDIPNTVKGGMASLKALGVDMTNVHASGGIQMMKAGLEGLSGGEHLPILIAVTQLTSTDQRMMEEELLIPKTVKEVVLHYGENAKAAGLHGVVCSPHEAKEIHERIGADFLTVTPGVRFAGGEVGDQKRVMTAENPVEAYREAVRQFCDA